MNAHIHRFEDAGLGKGPFRLIGMIEMPSISLAEANVDAYNNALREASQQALAMGVSPGSCDYCGTGLKYNYVVRATDGRNFIVGCDCVEYTGDAGLIDAVAQAEKRRKREAKEVQLRAEREKELAAQRERNDGKTDNELWNERRQQEIEERRAHRAAVAQLNGWLISFLQTLNSSDFVASMICKLADGDDLNTDFSDRQLQVLCDIYARGYRGKEKQERIDEFWNRVEATERRAA